jgi:hypothetical protein
MLYFTGILQQSIELSRGCDEIGRTSLRSKQRWSPYFFPEEQTLPASCFHLDLGDTSCFTVVSHVLGRLMYHWYHRHTHWLPISASIVWGEQTVLSSIQVFYSPFIHGSLKHKNNGVLIASISPLASKYFAFMATQIILLSKFQSPLHSREQSYGDIKVSKTYSLGRRNCFNLVVGRQ